MNGGFLKNLRQKMRGHIIASAIRKRCRGWAVVALALHFCLMLAHGTILSTVQSKWQDANSKNVFHLLMINCLLL